MPEASVLMVSGDLGQVENELVAGRFWCPGCDGRLAPWYESTGVVGFGVRGSTCG
jgi:hypothetical protein